MENNNNKSDVNKLDNESKNEGKGKTKRKKKSIFLKVLLGLFLFVAILVATAYAYLQSFSNNSVKIEKTDSNVSTTENNNTVEEPSNSMNFLVVGVDNGSGDEDDQNDPRRTDTMFVVHYNYKDKKYDVISIPRDTKVQINGKDQKVNAAHAIGKIPLAVKTVEKLLNIKIDHYVKIDTVGFRKFIDTIGGIDVIVDRDMVYDDPSQDLHINLNQSDQPQHLNGSEAEGFIRWRKNNNGGGYAEGDIGRIKHMQGFFSTIVDKLQSPTIITKIPGILSIFPKYVETDLNATDIMKFAMSLVKTQKENIKYHVVPGEAKYENGISYYFYDNSKNKELNAIFSDIDYVDVNQQKIRVKIVNGTKNARAASDFGKAINKLGFTNYDISNGSAVSESKITIYGADQKAIDYIKNQFGISNLEISSKHNNSYEVEVILGTDGKFLNPKK